MIELGGLQDTFGAIVEDVKTFVTEKPLATAGVGAGVVAATAGLVIAKTRKKAKRRVARVRKKRGRSRDIKFRSKQKHELAYVRRKRKRGKKITRPRYKTKKRSKSRKGIHYTKKGQPYKILANGRARFIKKTKRRKS